MDNNGIEAGFVTPPVLSPVGSPVPRGAPVKKKGASNINNVPGQVGKKACKKLFDETVIVDREEKRQQ